MRDNGRIDIADGHRTVRWRRHGADWLRSNRQHRCSHIDPGAIDLAGGNNKLTLGNFTNSATVANVQTVTGGTGADSITLGSALTAAMAVDLGTGAGVNKLTLGNFANTGSVSNVSTLIGNSGADTVTYDTALVNGSVDLGSGSDKLTLADLANSATVSNTETIAGDAACCS